jgi:hypothetical protein
MARARTKEAVLKLLSNSCRSSTLIADQSYLC